MAFLLNALAYTRPCASSSGVSSASYSLYSIAQSSIPSLYLLTVQPGPFLFVVMYPVKLVISMVSPFPSILISYDTEVNKRLTDQSYFPHVGHVWRWRSAELAYSSRSAHAGHLPGTPDPSTSNLPVPAHSWHIGGATGNCISDTSS